MNVRELLDTLHRYDVLDPTLPVVVVEDDDATDVQRADAYMTSDGRAAVGLWIEEASDED